MKTKVVLGISVCCLMFTLGGLVLPFVGVAQMQTHPYKPAEQPPALRFLHLDGSRKTTESPTLELLKSFVVPAYTFENSIIVMFDFGFDRYVQSGSSGAEGRVALLIDGQEVKTLTGKGNSLGSHDYLRLFGADSTSVYEFAGDMSVSHTVELWGQGYNPSPWAGVSNNLLMIMGT